MILMPDTELRNGGDKDKPESAIQTHQWRLIWFALQVIIFFIKAMFVYMDLIHYKTFLFSSV